MNPSGNPLYPPAGPLDPILGSPGTPHGDTLNTRGSPRPPRGFPVPSRAGIPLWDSLWIPLDPLGDSLCPPELGPPSGPPTDPPCLHLRLQQHEARKTTSVSLLFLVMLCGGKGEESAAVNTSTMAKVSGNTKPTTPRDVEPAGVNHWGRVEQG